MRFRDGRLSHKLLFFSLIVLFLITTVTLFATYEAGLGKPNIGINGSPVGYPYVAPAGRAAIKAELCYGSELVAINGVPVPSAETVGAGTESYMGVFSASHVHDTEGAINVFTIDSPYDDPDDPPYDVAVPVTLLTWGDIFRMVGSPIILACLFFIGGVGTFIARPWEVTSWAKLQFSTLFGAFLMVSFSQDAYMESWRHLFFGALSSMFFISPLGLALAFPNVHELARRRPVVLLGIFALSVPLFLLHVIPGHKEWINIVSPLVMLGTLSVALGRLVIPAVHSADRLIRQRARILLGGLTIAFVPCTVIWMLQSVWQIARVDLQLVLWSTLAFPIALGYTVIKYELLDTRVVMRRSMVYAVVVAFDVALGVALISFITGILEAQSPALVQYVIPAAFAVVVVGMVVWWPRTHDWLQGKLYPKRARLPELMAELGSEMALSTSTAALADVLASAPAKIADARSGVVFFFDDPEQHRDACAASAGRATEIDVAALEKEPLIQLMCATRKETHREGLSLDQQIVHIREDCVRVMNQLDAEILMPIVRESRVIGGLSIGPRVSGDVYDKAELNALSMLMQQAIQSLMRIQAFAELEAQRNEVSSLKQVFPTHIVDQVMAEGGVKSFRGQRKMVTVFFSDLRGFTSFSDTVEPEEVMATLHEYHRAMGLRVKEFGGTLERYTGDGMMVFFNDPVEQPDHVQRATRMAVAMRNDVAQLRESWVRKGYQLDVGMGIHTGFATVGFIGYEGRPDYGVIGNVTNMAARLCDHAGGGEVLVTTRVVSELGTVYETEAAGEMSLKGFREPQLVHRLLTEKLGDTANL